MTFLSQRSAVEPFRAMDVMAEAFRLGREGRSITHLAVGEPGAPTPMLARAAAAAALEHGRIGYTEALGTPALRARISRYPTSPRTQTLGCASPGWAGGLAPSTA